MEFLYRHGVTALQLLQKHGEPYGSQFQKISAFCDPSYAFLVYPPLIHALCQNSGRAMLLIVVVVEWTNMVLKWILMGHRPYWWVLENMKPSGPGDTIISQFPLTCETGPGSPSGHAELQAALNFAIVHFLTTKVFRKGSGQCLSGMILWPAYCALVIAVSLSRLYIAAHFPHQCILGALIGFTIAYTMVDMNTASWKRRHYLIMTAVLYGGVMATYYTLTLAGVDVLRTLTLARKHCSNPAWVHVDTTPYFSMVRFLSFCSGMGLAVTCNRFSITGRRVALPTRVAMGVAAAVVGKLSENVPIPFRGGAPLVFYSAAMVYFLCLAYLLFALVPFVVLKLIGGEVKEDKSKATLNGFKKHA